jgi:hypothetical protein
MERTIHFAAECTCYNPRERRDDVCAALFTVDTNESSLLLESWLVRCCRGYYYDHGRVLMQTNPLSIKKSKPNECD